MKQDSSNWKIDTDEQHFDQQVLEDLRVRKSRARGVCCEGARDDEL